MQELEAILNFTPVDARLASSGQPGAEQFGLIAGAGFEAVANLATQASTGHLPAEPELCAGHGLAFTWLPVSWDKPTPEDYLSFQDWLDANRARKVLVHCAKNWRASMFCALYRVLREGLPLEEARAQVLDVWEPDAAWTALSREVLARAGRAEILF